MRSVTGITDPLELLKLGRTALVTYEVTLVSVGFLARRNQAQTQARTSISIVPTPCVRRLDKQWRIFYELFTGWHWEHVLEDGNVFTGPSGFATYRDCFVDATRNGCFAVDLPAQGVQRAGRERK